MIDNTIVAVYETVSDAEPAVADLKAAGIPASAISMHAEAATVPADTTQRPVREEGFCTSLFGGEPDHDIVVYDRSVESSATVVSVRIAHAHADRVIELLEKHHPVDIDECANNHDVTQTAPT